jgi:predicted amidohydrolase
VGKDNNHLRYQGGSVCIDHKGKVLGRLEDNKEEIRTFTIDKQPMERFREIAPFWKQAD